MNIAKALKVKNRLVGELNLLRSQASQYNMTSVTVLSIDENTRAPFSLNLKEIWEKIAAIELNLISLKTRITVASAKIAHALVELAECKSKIAYLQAIPIREGTQVTNTVNGPSYNVFASYIGLVQKNELVASFQERINVLQDVIDDYNASTQV